MIISDEAYAGILALSGARTLNGVECDHTGIGKPGCLVCDVREQRR